MLSASLIKKKQLSPSHPSGEPKRRKCQPVEAVARYKNTVNSPSEHLKDDNWIEQLLKTHHFNEVFTMWS